MGPGRLRSERGSRTLGVGTAQEQSEGKWRKEEDEGLAVSQAANQGSHTGFQSYSSQWPCKVVLLMPVLRMRKLRLGDLRSHSN